MEEKRYPCVLIIALAFVLCFLQQTLAAIVLLAAVIFIAKDEKLVKKVLQPTLILLAVLAVKAALNYIFGYIEDFLRIDGKSYAAADMSAFLTSMSFILDIALIACLVLGIVFFLSKKDMPIVGKIADKLVSACCKKNDCTVKTEVPQDSTEVKQESTEVKQENTEVQQASIEASQEDTEA